jgi:hypothetical protein
MYLRCHVITHRYTSEKDDFMNLFLIPRLDVPELVLDAYDAHKFKEVWRNVSIMISLFSSALCLVIKRLCICSGYNIFYGTI